MEFYYTVSVTDLRAAYAPFIPAVPLLLPASSWQRVNFKRPTLPSQVTRTAADSGGFVATFKWGDYRYTPERYVEWLETWRPNWAATMDYCCEPEVAANAGIVRQRQQRTSDMAYQFWRDYPDAPWTWAPTIQGWNVEDYRRHARELRTLIMQMSDRPDFRVGIGTLCHRASVFTIHQVVRAVVEELPGVPLHLWGVKLGALQSINGLPKEVISVDSAAWNGYWGKDISKFRAERQALGMTKARFSWTVMLARYQAKVEATRETPKQGYLL
jgi:hypothetical protein